MKKSCEILVVDDELLIRQGVINYVDWEAEGFKVIGGAANGEEALEIIEEKKPHIVITDVVMPIMDGIELVKRIKRYYPRIEVVVLSSFEDYDYVRSTFQSGVADYILKPQLNGDKLLKTLKEIARGIPELQQTDSKLKINFSLEEILLKLLYRKKLNEEGRKIISKISHGKFTLLQIVLKEDTIYNPSLEDEVLPWLRQFCKQNNCQLYVLGSLKDQALILLNARQKMNHILLEALQKRVVNFPKTYGLLHYLISEEFHKIEQLKEIYETNLCSLKEILFYLPNESILSNDTLPSIEGSSLTFDLNHFATTFKAEQYNLALDYVSEHIEHFSKQYNRDSFEFKTFIGNIIFNVIVLMGNLDFDIEEMEKGKYQYLSLVNDTKNVHQTIEVYDKFIYEVKEILFQNQGGDHQSQIQKMLRYIEDHYAEPLSLTSVAKHFHFNPSYLSAYFSTHHNEGFNEYLNRIRIKKGMELLRDSSLSIADISWMVGYSGHSYFCKVFKKITGFSPSEYRKGQRV